MICDCCVVSFEAGERGQDSTTRAKRNPPHSSSKYDMIKKNLKRVNKVALVYIVCLNSLHIQCLLIMYRKLWW
jgi:hypothetical protein